MWWKGQTSSAKSKYFGIPTDELVKLWDEQSRRESRGIGNCISLYDGPIDDRIRREIHIGHTANGYGIIVPYDLIREKEVPQERIGGIFYSAWLVPTDHELERELLARGFSKGEYHGDGVWSPKSLIPKEKIEAHKKEIISIMERKGDRLLVIDACKSEELDSRLNSYAGREGIFVTPYNHRRPDIVYGPIPSQMQLGLF